MMTTEEFWNQLGQFNDKTWHIQAVWMFITLVVMFVLLFRRTSWANISMKIMLSIAFAWNGVAFFLIFSEGPIYDFFFAPLFIIIASLFALDIFAKRIKFGLPEKGWKRYSFLFWILLWLAYPFIGMALGRPFPFVCTPMNPCPSTVFAITLMIAAIPEIDIKVYIMLIPWALLGLPKCLGMYNCYEDCILFTSGIYGLIMLITSWRVINQRRLHA
jgi:hypothetical protein